MKRNERVERKKHKKETRGDCVALDCVSAIKWATFLGSVGKGSFSWRVQRRQRSRRQSRHPCIPRDIFRAEGISSSNLSLLYFYRSDLAMSGAASACRRVAVLSGDSSRSTTIRLQGQVMTRSAPARRIHTRSNPILTSASSSPTTRQHIRDMRAFQALVTKNTFLFSMSEPTSRRMFTAAAANESEESDATGIFATRFLCISTRNSLTAKVDP